MFVRCSVTVVTVSVVGSYLDLLTPLTGTQLLSGARNSGAPEVSAGTCLREHVALVTQNRGARAPNTACVGMPPKDIPHKIFFAAWGPTAFKTKMAPRIKTEMRRHPLKVGVCVLSCMQSINRAPQPRTKVWLPWQDFGRDTRGSWGNPEPSGNNHHYPYGCGW